LSFLIVGHTHEDIDQRFSFISSALKREDIDSLPELLEKIRERPTHTEPFVHVEHLEHIRDWKKFITPYLRTDAFVGISQPHHFRFYMNNNKPHVQYKPYSRSPAWKPEHGHECLQRIPSIDSQVDLASVAEPDGRELRALEDFILLKERHIVRHMNIEKSLKAVAETSKLIAYMHEFPLKDRTEERNLPFWPQVHDDIHPNDALSSERNGHDSAICNVLHSLPPVLVSDYFGPRSQMPKNHRVRKVSHTRERGREHRQNQTNATRAHPITSVANPIAMLDLHKEVEIGMFVAMETSDEDMDNGIPFFIGKVLKTVAQTTSDGEAQVLWYQPKMPIGLKDDVGKFFKRYQNCIERMWEPSRECNDFVPIKSIFSAWKNTVGTRNVTSVLGIRTEKEMKIPDDQKNSMYHHLEAIEWQHVGCLDTVMTNVA
jgi:hypothetical protein